MKLMNDDFEKVDLNVFLQSLFDKTDLDLEHLDHVLVCLQFEDKNGELITQIAEVGHCNKEYYYILGRNFAESLVKDGCAEFILSFTQGMSSRVIEEYEKK